VAGQGRKRLLERLLAGEGDLDTARLGRVCAEATEMSGAGVMLMSDDVPVGSLCTTDEVSALIEELQFALGEGPCIDAFHHDRPVIEPDLVEPQTLRWPAFSPPVIAAGGRAVFGFPLRQGAVHLGALNLYRDAAGPLSDDQHADALVMADLVTQAVLLFQADAPPGQLAGALEERADLQARAHQASGMVAAQSGISVGQALIRLRSHAFRTDRPLSAVVDDVIDRSLVFEREDPT
jgi:GAF domain-containing protein